MIPRRHFTPEGEVLHANGKQSFQPPVRVAEEQDELFPKVREAGLDARAVGEELADRKAELMRALA